MVQHKDHRLNAETLAEIESHYAKEFPGQPTYEEQSLADRVRRCLSWARRAVELSPADTPPRFVDLWIGLNALYGVRPYDPGFTPDEKRHFLHFFRKVAYADRADGKLLELAKRIERRTLGLIKNPHLWYEFWRGQHPRVKTEMEDERKSCEKAYDKSDLETIFECLFERIFILRNQIMHGSSSENTIKSQDALAPALLILEDMLQVFLAILLTHHKAIELQPVPFPGSETQQYPKPRN